MQENLIPQHHWLSTTANLIGISKTDKKVQLAFMIFKQFNSVHCYDLSSLDIQALDEVNKLEVYIISLILFKISGSFTLYSAAYLSNIATCGPFNISIFKASQTCARILFPI